MRLRLFLAFGLIVVISITSVVLLARQGAAREVNTYMFRGGMYGAEGIISTLETYYREHESWNNVEKTLLSKHGTGRGTGGINQELRLADEQGHVIVDTTHSPQDEDLSLDEIDAAIPLQVNGQLTGYLLFANKRNFTVSDSESLLKGWNRAALMAAFVGGLLSLLLALLLAYGLLRPVRELTHAANTLAYGDLTQRVAVRGSDEMALLGRTFNQMAEALQKAEETRRALTADIAHELRTPLAVQRANLEAMQDGVFPISPENLQSVLEQNLLLTHLVNDLHTLALADAGQLQLEFSPTDFVALAQNVVENFKPAAIARQVNLSLDFHSQPLQKIFADPLRIEQVINNLISNALHHTPDGGFVTCKISNDNGRMIFTIHDSGPGIPSEALPYIFDRFYRADKARSRAQGGSGLGLAIARQLVEAHQGTLIAENHPRGGAILTLTLLAPSHNLQSTHET